MNRSSGFTLIEVLVAMLIFGIGISSSIGFFYKDYNDYRSEWRLRYLSEFSANLNDSILKKSKKNVTNDFLPHKATRTFQIVQTVAEIQLDSISEFCLKHELMIEQNSNAILSMSECYYETK